MHKYINYLLWNIYEIHIVLPLKIKAKSDVMITLIHFNYLLLIITDLLFRPYRYNCIYKGLSPFFVAKA